MIVTRHRVKNTINNKQKENKIPRTKQLKLRYTQVRDEEISEGREIQTSIADGASALSHSPSL